MYNSPIASQGGTQLLLQEFSAFLPDKGHQILMAIGGSVGAFFSFFFGEMNKGILWLLLFVVIDYVLGVLVARKEHSWASSVGFIGVTKKAVVFIIVGLCHGLDESSGQNLVSFQTIVIFAYLINELGSILENMELLGLGEYIPYQVRTMLRVVKERTDKEIEDVGSRGEKAPDGMAFGRREGHHKAK